MLAPFFRKGRQRMAQSAQSGLTRFAWNAGVAGIVIAAGGILGVQLGLWAPMVALAPYVSSPWALGPGGRGT